MNSLRLALREVIAKHGLPAVYAGLQEEMQELYGFLRSHYEPPKNNLVIPIAGVIPDRIATPRNRPIAAIIEEELPPFELEENEGENKEETQSLPVDPTLKEVVVQAKSEMMKQQGEKEKFTKAKHREEVLKKHKELTEQGIRPESLLTKENLTKWLGEGLSYMRISREHTGVPENEIAAIAKTFGLQSDLKKYIVMRKGAK
jgi:hypothetical protein